MPEVNPRNVRSESDRPPLHKLAAHLKMLPIMTQTRGWRTPGHQKPHFQSQHRILVRTSTLRWVKTSKEWPSLPQGPASLAYSKPYPHQIVCGHSWLSRVCRGARPPQRRRPLLPLDLGHDDPLHTLGGGQIEGPDLRQGVGSGRVVEGLAIGNKLGPVLDKLPVFCWTRLWAH